MALAIEVGSRSTLQRLEAAFFKGFFLARVELVPFPACYRQRSKEAPVESSLPVRASAFLCFSPPICETEH